MTSPSDTHKAETGTNHPTDPKSPRCLIDIDLDYTGPVRSTKAHMLRRAKAWKGSIPELNRLYDDLYELGGDESAESRAICGPVLMQLLLHENLPVLWRARCHQLLAKQADTFAAKRFHLEKAVSTFEGLQDIIQRIIGTDVNADNLQEDIERDVEELKKLDSLRAPRS